MRSEERQDTDNAAQLPESKESTAKLFQDAWPTKCGPGTGGSDFSIKGGCNSSAADRLLRGLTIGGERESGESPQKPNSNPRDAEGNAKAQPEGVDNPKTAHNKVGDGGGAEHEDENEDHPESGKHDENEEENESDPESGKNEENEEENESDPESGKNEENEEENEDAPESGQREENEEENEDDDAESSAKTQLADQNTMEANKSQDKNASDCTKIDPGDLELVPYPTNKLEAIRDRAMTEVRTALQSAVGDTRSQFEMLPLNKDGIGYGQQHISFLRERGMDDAARSMSTYVAAAGRLSWGQANFEKPRSAQKPGNTLPDLRLDGIYMRKAAR